MGIIFVIASACANSSGQSTFMGLTPGASTRQAERVFGPPVQSVSQTLIEYKSQLQEADKLYVQYRGASPDAVFERIELTCNLANRQSRCDPLIWAMEKQYGAKSELIDIKKGKSPTRTMPRCVI